MAGVSQAANSNWSVSCSASFTGCRRPPCCRRRRRSPQRTTRQDFALRAPADTIRAGAICATVDPVRLERVTMPDQTQVAINRPRCSCAAWAEAGGAVGARRRRPRRRRLGAPLAALTDLDSYECRGRNRVAAPSCRSTQGQHARCQRHQASQRRGFNLTDPLVARPFREQMRSMACARSPRCSARLRQLSQRPHPSRSHRALARYRNVPKERARSDGDR